MEAAQDPASGGDKAVTAAASDASAPHETTSASSETTSQPSADTPQAANEPDETVPQASAEAPPAAESESVKTSPLILLPPRRGENSRANAESEAPPRAATSRRFSLLAASIALAAGLGGMLGAASFAGLSKFITPEAAVIMPADNTAELQDVRNQLSLMRASIKSMTETVTAPVRAPTDKALNAQVGKLAEAIERLERSHAEPNGRLAKLTEAVDRLEKKVAAAQPVAAAAAPQAAAAPAAPQTTGSVKPQPEHSLQNQIVEGWRLHEVYNGVALIEGRYGQMEVAPGDDVRGLGRVQTIRRQPDGRWAVTTTRGMIVSSR